MHILPMAGNLYSVEFGRNLDSHGEGPDDLLDLISVHRPRRLAIGDNEEVPRCHFGRVCYVDTLYLTIGSCMLSIILSGWAGWRDWRRVRMADQAVKEETETH